MKTDNAFPAEEAYTSAALPEEVRTDSGPEPVSLSDDLAELSVEDAFGQLEQLISRMEEPGISLEESFACYERGVQLIRHCNDRIDRVEKKVQMLRGEGRPAEELP